MHKDLEALCLSLETLSKSVLDGWAGDQTFLETWGWNCPAVTRHDMSGVALQLAQEIRDSKTEQIDKSILTVVLDYPRRLTLLQAQTVPQFWGSNCGPATAVYLSSLNALRQSLLPLLSWQVIPDTKAMPVALARKLRSLQLEIDQIIPNKDKLISQISEIQEAHTVAESLPLDLEALKEARDRVVRLADESAVSAEKTKSASSDAADKLISTIISQESAQKLVDQCEEAYRITTTKGLAGAFDQRANRLSLSMLGWVFGLLCALSIGSLIGSQRIELLSKAISETQLNWGVIALQVVLSLLSVGAPVWFAWISTKQIGQRFRLAEDYAFKASVAKAYEGYRKEAARIDPAFEARLFSSALTRLEEAPLRLVEQETHGSPYHEFFASPQFQNALSTFIDLKNKSLELTKQGVSALLPNQVTPIKRTVEGE